LESLETKVAVIEHDLKQIQVVFSRLDLAIEKIGDVSNCINKMLAVHDTKLEAQETVNEDIYRSLEVHRQETKESNAELHSRITTTTRELESKIQSTEDKMLAAIKDLKVSVDKEEEKNIKRIDKLEKTKYIMIGGGIVLGAIITKILPMLMKFIQ
jgi:chromosome condensin MukBEF complex kleisin-like MukF subunit